MSAAERLFAGPGDVRALARILDWAGTPLGPVEDWAPALRHAVRLMLDAPVAMSLWCGPGRVFLYNEANLRVLGTKHPSALGRPGAQVFAELWSVLQPQVDAVIVDGASISLDGMPLSLDRGAAGEADEGSFDYTLSPVYDAPDAPDPVVVAVLGTVTETTGRRRAERALEVERERLHAVVMAAPAPMALHVGPAHRYELVNEAYRRISGGGRDVTGMTPREAFPELAGHGIFDVLDRVYVTGEAFVVSEMLVRYDRSGRGVEDTYFNLRLEPVLRIEAREDNHRQEG